MSKIDEIRKRLNSRPGEETYDPTYLYKNAHEDVTFLLEHIQALEKESTTLLDMIEKRDEKLAKAKIALEFYASEESMSCRLRNKHEDTPMCLTGDSDYFQDPADLPILQDGGKLARTTLAEIES